MFNIKIDEALLSYLATEDVKFEEFLVIACLNMEASVPLRAYLRNKNPDQMLAYLQSLERKLLLKRLVDIEEFSWDNYELTDYADRLFEACSQHIIPESSLIKGVAPVEKVAKLVEDYRAIFPEGIRNAGGEYLKGNEKDITTKLNTFLSKHKYSAETILGATTNYVNQQAREQYKWCSAAHFFISKNGVSKLATECEAFKGKIDEPGVNWQDTLM